MELTDFVPPSFDGDRLKCEDFLNRPAIVAVSKIVTGLTTEYSPNGDGEGIVCDIVDVGTGHVYLAVLWMTGAVRDGLKTAVGKTVAIKLVQRPSKNGRNYIGVEPLAGEEKARAQQFAQARPDAFDQERARRTQQAPAQGNGGGGLAGAEISPMSPPASPAQWQTPPAAQQPVQQQLPQTAPAPPASSSPSTVDPSTLPADMQALLAQYMQNNKR